MHTGHHSISWSVQIIAYYSVVPDVVGTTNTCSMTGFEASGGWRWQDGLTCSCHTFALYCKYTYSLSLLCKYEFIPFTSPQSLSTWNLRTGHIALTAVLSKTEYRILYG